MHSRVLRIGVVASVTAASLIVGLLPAHAETDREKQKRIDKAIQAQQDDLDGATKSLQNAAKALRTAKTEIPKAKATLAAARRDYSIAKAQEAAVVDRLNIAQAEADAAQKQVDSVLAAMETTRGVINNVARTVYQQGPYGQYETILESGSPAELASRLQSVKSVVRNQDHLLGDLGEQRATLAEQQVVLNQALAMVAAQRDEARKQREAAASATRRADAAKKRVEALVLARARALTVASREKAAELRRLNALKDEQRRLRALLSGTGDGSAYPTGSLLWPAAGQVRQGVGPRIHPVYGYKSCHTGVDIGAGYGATIKAAASGTVVQVLSGGPYGNHTVIDHGGGLATMYAHQSRIVVKQGQRVTKGATIGYVGSTGWATGPHLHFEVWIGGRPYDPMGWFGSAKRPVVC